MKRKLILSAVGCSALAGCVNLQTDVKPLQISNTNKAICIVENHRVYEGFVGELEAVMHARGYKVLRFDSDSLINKKRCEVRLTYNVRRRWDFGYYIGMININVYNIEGVRVAGIYYDMGRGGNFAKYGTATEKLTPLVDKMLPASGDNT